MKIAARNRRAHQMRAGFAFGGLNPNHWMIVDEFDVRYVGPPGGAGSFATVGEFHRWLQSEADNEFELDITSLNPSYRVTQNIIELVNSYNIDDKAAEHLYDGAIIQDDGAQVWETEAPLPTWLLPQTSPATTWLLPQTSPATT